LLLLEITKTGSEVAVQEFVGAGCERSEPAEGEGDVALGEEVAVSERVVRVCRALQRNLELLTLPFETREANRRRASDERREGESRPWNRATHLLLLLRSPAACFAALLPSVLNYNSLSNFSSPAVLISPFSSASPAPSPRSAAVFAHRWLLRFACTISLVSMTTAWDFAWGHLNPVHEIPSVTVEATAEKWRAFFRDRDALIRLLLSQQTVFKFPEDERAKAYILGFITKALQQTIDHQNEPRVWNNFGGIGGQRRGVAFALSFTGEALHARPFCSVSSPAPSDGPQHN